MMITTIVKYRSARQLSREEVGKMMEYGARERFLGLPHLHSKQFCFNVETGEGLSVYLWDSRESADAFSPRISSRNSKRSWAPGRPSNITKPSCWWITARAMFS